jgi:DNA-binding phage protein
VTRLRRDVSRSRFVKREGHKVLTFEQLAKQAGLADADTVREIEYGSDAKMSDVTAITKVLGLRLKLVSQVVRP